MATGETGETYETMRRSIDVDPCGKAMLFPGTRFMSRILLATLLAASPVIARAADQPAPAW